MTAPPPPTDAVGSPAWANRMVETVLPPNVATAVKLCVVEGTDKFASLHRARIKYTELALGAGWEGWAALMAWDCIVAIVKPLADADDIPF